jgi:hypothetical protein
VQPPLAKLLPVQSYGIIVLTLTGAIGFTAAILTIITANVITLVLALIVLCFKFRYRKD